MLNLPAETWLRFAIWMAIGFAVYFFYGRTHSRLGLQQAAEAGSRRHRRVARLRSSFVIDPVGRPAPQIPLRGGDSRGRVACCVSPVRSAAR